MQRIIGYVKPHYPNNYNGRLRAIIYYFGIVGLNSGTTRDKRGKELSAGAAKVTSLIRLVGGVALMCLAVYILIFGAW